MKKTFLFLLIFSLFICACSDTHEIKPKNDVPKIYTSLPITVTESDTVIYFMHDGQIHKIYVNGYNPTNTTRAISGGQKVYERNPDATLSSTPRLISAGKYQKVALNSFSPLANISGAKMILVRVNKYSVECNAPAGVNPFSYKIENITKQGFSDTNLDAFGYQVTKMENNTKGVFVTLTYFTKEGIAYDVSGRQLTPNTPYPINGMDVKYQYTYSY